MKKIKMRYEKNKKEYLYPNEINTLRILVQNHLNSVSEILLHGEHRIHSYLAELEELERKLVNNYYHNDDLEIYK